MEEKLNESTKQLQLAQTKFQASLHEQDAQNKVLMEALRALKSRGKVESLYSKRKEKEPAVQ